MKKILALFTSLVMTISLSSAAFAAEVSKTETVPISGTSVYLSATDKMTFAANMDKVYKQQAANNLVKTPTREIIDSLILQVPNSSPAEKEKLYDELASYGVYKFDCPVLPSTASAPHSGDVTVEAPTIFYEAWCKCWTVTFGGEWDTTNYGDTDGNVGGKDGYGVGFTNCKNEYKSQVVRCSAYIADADHKHTESTKNRSDGDGSKGFGFRFQDYIVDFDTYVGQKWGGSCTYDSWFGMYNGVATAYYIHTYDTTELNSVSFGLDGKTAGINASLSVEKNYFTAFSNDTAFGVYP